MEIVVTNEVLAALVILIVSVEKENRLLREEKLFHQFTQREEDYYK